MSSTNSEIGRSVYYIQTPIFKEKIDPSFLQFEFARGARFARSPFWHLEVWKSIENINSNFFRSLLSGGKKPFYTLLFYFPHDDHEQSCNFIIVFEEKINPKQLVKFSTMKKIIISAIIKMKNRIIIGFFLLTYFVYELDSYFFC